HGLPGRDGRSLVGGHVHPLTHPKELHVRTDFAKCSTPSLTRSLISQNRRRSSLCWAHMKLKREALSPIGSWISQDRRRSSENASPNSQDRRRQSENASPNSQDLRR